MTYPEPPPGLPPSSDQEFIDEAPGTYLAELGTRTASVVWGGVNCALTIAVGLSAHFSGLSPKSEWYTLARLAWALLPLSSGILAIVTLWQLGTAYTEKSPARTLLALGAGVLGLLIWACFAYWWNVLPAPETEL